MVLVDLNRFEHKLELHHVNWMIGIGWTSFIFSWILNIVYYKLHPSAVDFNTGRFKKNEMFVYIFGQKRYFYKPEGLIDIGS